MKRSFVLLFVLLALFTAASVLAQPSIRYISYNDDGTNPPLRCPCTNGPAIPIGSASICVYWDNNHNGPDAADSLVREGHGYGESNWSCQSLNGDPDFGTPGYFFTEDAFRIANLPVDPDTALYYLEINTSNCCWRSDVYWLTAGPGEIIQNASDWACVDQRCNDEPPPNAPTNFDIDSVGCLNFTVEWDHDGLNLTGFQVFGVFGGRDSLLRVTSADSRGERVQILTDQAVPCYVKASNAGGSSLPSNTDVGRTWLIEFAPGADGNLWGWRTPNSEFTIRFVQPGVPCPAGLQLYIYYGGQAHDLLCTDSLTQLMRCRLPNRAITEECRLMLRDSSFDRGVIFTDLTDSTFRVGTAAGDYSGALPDHFELSQNHPNPFNPVTEIQFAVPMEAQVRIEIYNVMGQLVRTLVGETYSAGFHRIFWNGTSDAGIAVGSGLYLCRMSAPNFVQTRKMLLMK